MIRIDLTDGEGENSRAVTIKVTGKYSPDILDDMTRRATQMLQESNNEFDLSELEDAVEDAGTGAQ